MWNQQPGKFGEVFRIGPNTFIPPPSSSFIPTSSRLSPAPSEPKRSPTPTTKPPVKSEGLTQPKSPEPVKPHPEIRPKTPERVEPQLEIPPKTPKPVQPQSEIQPKTPEKVLSQPDIQPKTPEPEHPKPDIQPKTPESVESQYDVQPKTAEPVQCQPEIQPETPEPGHPQPEIQPQQVPCTFLETKTKPDVPQAQLEIINPELVEVQHDIIDSGNTNISIKVTTDKVIKEVNTTTKEFAKEVDDKIQILDKRVIITELDNVMDDITAADVESQDQPPPIIVESNFENIAINTEVIPEIQFEIEEIKAENASDAIPSQDYEKSIPEEEEDIREIEQKVEVQNLQLDADCEFPIEPPTPPNLPPVLISAQAEIASAQIVTETGKTKIT